MLIDRNAIKYFCVTLHTKDISSIPHNVQKCIFGGKRITQLKAHFQQLLSVEVNVAEFFQVDLQNHNIHNKKLAEICFHFNIIQ